ncbi:MAG: endolytic transglycosylase MltG [Caldisericia bacterium]
MKYLKIFLIFFVILIILFLSIGFYAYYESQPPSDFVSKEVYIKDNLTTEEIAEKLKNENIIKNKIIFSLLAKYLDIEDKLKSGIYEFEEKMNVRDVLIKLTEGGLSPYIKVTIPEGLKLTEIAEIFEKNNLCTKEEFLDEVKDIDKYKKYIFEDANTLEGFLYPDTYFFEKENLTKNIEMMLNNFIQKFNEVYKCYSGDLNKYDILKLASIVEKEAQDKNERPIIAGVFINRLNLNMLLQADPTLKYILPDAGYTLTSKELEIDSPYNSYKYPGLPPTPICNPGIESIKATINPEKTEYLYFVAKGDGTHLFAKTFEEHLRNISKVMP